MNQLCRDLGESTLGRGDSSIKSQALRPGMFRKQRSQYIQDKGEEQVQIPGSRVDQL